MLGEFESALAVGRGFVAGVVEEEDGTVAVAGVEEVEEEGEGEREEEEGGGGGEEVVGVG